MQVIYSEIAKSSLKENIKFLKRLWTPFELDIFLSDIEIVLKNLKNGNFQHYKIEKKNICSVLIGKRHVKMYFRKESEELIRVLLFFEMRQDPKKIAQLLK
ncbi:hypothetical protein [Frigoriflavimonas asaccharolytica]|uniref:Plasmid stabilization system protein ParE n=1 Tax=Frigoriflavimonas asaccharolytica TaxID=2735899 RepID=A0A8J8G9C2_9FLAO|nr:hypothetical protein [Frigoriflavimonas asaccharolytica]NRS93729.1 hypothetical protein [Frigoriflavimonas asaccharolytica]